MPATGKKSNSLEIEAIGKLIRIARRRKGVSQTVLGDMLGVSFQQVQKYEKGKNRVPADRLAKIASYLGVPITYFYTEKSLELAELVTDQPTMALIERLNALPENRRKELLNAVNALVDYAASVEKNKSTAQQQEGTVNGDH